MSALLNVEFVCISKRYNAADNNTKDISTYLTARTAIMKAKRARSARQTPK